MRASIPEAGVNPARPRHCERPREVRGPDTLRSATEATASGRRGIVASSQETCSPVSIRRHSSRARGAAFFALADALAAVPGVVLVPRGTGGSVEVQLRGGGTDHVLVLVDGAPLNDPITGAADLSTVPAAQIESISVIPGARSARYGAGALTGVVLVDTHSRPVPHEGAVHMGSLDAIGGELTLGAASDGTSASLGGTLRRVGGAFDFHQSEGLGGGTRERRNADLTQRSIHGGYRPGSPEARCGPDSGGRRRTGECQGAASCRPILRGSPREAGMPTSPGPGRAPSGACPPASATGTIGFGSRIPPPSGPPLRPGDPPGTHRAHPGGRSNPDPGKDRTR
jgi:hypothetical protein